MKTALYPVIPLTLAFNTASADVFVQWRSDALRSTAGGIDKGSVHIGHLDFGFKHSFTGLFNEESNLLVSAFYNNGNIFSELVGDIQVVSNIEADDKGFRLHEAWLDQPLPIGESSLLLGKYDMNGEFDVLETALPFINSAFGIGTDIGQTGVNGPSIYPATGLAARLKVQLNTEWNFKVAAIDGVPGDPGEPGKTDVRLDSDEGALIIAELAYENEGRRLLGGYWHYTESLEPLCQATGCSANNLTNEGYYLRGESTILNNNERLRLDGFFRIGNATGDFNPFHQFASAGILMSVPFPSRQEDRLGIAVAYGSTSEEFKRTARANMLQPESAEGVIELTYVAQITSSLVLQPTIQFIESPGVNQNIDDAWAYGLRLDYTYSSE